MRHAIPSLIHGSMPLAALAASLLARRRWSFIAGACLVAAVALWAVFGVKPAFVAATLGVVAWFWDERTRLRPIAIEAERERRRALEEDEGDEDVEERDERDSGEPRGESEGSDNATNEDGANGGDANRVGS